MTTQSTGPHVVMVRRGIRVTIADVTDPGLRRATDSAARQTLRHLSGKWDVSLRRSLDGRSWQLRVRGASGQHVSCFETPSGELPVQIVERLRAFLDYVRREPRRRSGALATTENTEDQT
jgi:hypothetical protein